MNNIEKRIKELENRFPRRLTVKDLSSDELAEMLTGIPGTKADDLTDEYLQAVARGEQPALPYKRRTKMRF